MKKLKRGRKFSRKRDQRRALLKSLASSLFLREKIKTTEAKAKEISIFAQKFITKAKNIVIQKKDTLATKRFLFRFFSKEVVEKLIKEIAPRYKERAGGYTRIIKLGPRQSDGAKMAIIELIK
ncbi:MAG: 50S ribosomal protein L17 [Patescibacteria group bacterium]